MDVNVGDLVNVDIFAAGETVDVIGTSKGKGYNGTIVRNNAHQGPKLTVDLRTFVTSVH